MLLRCATASISSDYVMQTLVKVEALLTIRRRRVAAADQMRRRSPAQLGKDSAYLR
jgi:hypothetical protein